MSPVIIIATLAGFVLLMIFISLVTWYRKCPSDRIMIIYGKTGGNQAAKCIHGGAKFVWPVVQDYGYISLRPLQIAVNLDNALIERKGHPHRCRRHAGTYGHGLSHGGRL